MWDSKSESGASPRTVGAWMDGERAESHPALLELAGATLRVLSVDEKETYAIWPLAALHIDSMHEGQTVHIECREAPEAVVTTNDTAFVRALIAAGARGTGLPVGRKRLVLALGCALGAVALLASIYFASPWLSYRMAVHVPFAFEERLAPEVHALLEGDTCQGPGADAAIATLLGRLHPKTGLPVDVRVVNLSMPNAFALPGGMIVLTRGLVEEASSPDEVAGVLAHELAHVSHRHVLAHMIQNAFLGAIWAVTLGDYSGLMVIDPNTAYRVATLRFSRDAEREADASALGMLEAGHVSSRGLAAFFERHAHEGGDVAWLSTHPGTDERLRLIRRQRVPAGASPSLDEASFQALKKACSKVQTKDSLVDLFK